jgi:uncharacterized repeat protein (TIGR03847 family)
VSSFDLGEIDAFTTGTVGPPGERVFYLQARDGRAVVTFKCEKQQVAVLGSSLERLLADLPSPTDGPLPTALELVDPIEPAWVVGQMTLAFDPGRDRFVLELWELVPQDEESEGEEGAEPGADRSRARMLLSRGQARAFAGHAERVVAAGRPACRFCGGPIDPDGHACPRMN